MNSRLKTVVIFLNVLYPFLVFAGLVYLKAPVRVFSFALIAVLAINILANYQSLADGNRLTILRMVLWALTVLCVIALIVVTDNAGYAKLYPVIVNAFFFAAFAWSILRPPTMVWRFATLRDKKLASHPERPSIEIYCRKVTLVWCTFFVFNALAALYTAVRASDALWSIYNGMISYILMGILFAGEYLIRRRVMKSL